MNGVLGHGFTFMRLYLDNTPRYRTNTVLKILNETNATHTALKIPGLGSTYICEHVCGSGRGSGRGWGRVGAGVVGPVQQVVHDGGVAVPARLDQHGGAVLQPMRRVRAVPQQQLHNLHAQNALEMAFVKLYGVLLVYVIGIHLEVFCLFEYQ
jgi:hypothetical protein